MYAHHMLRVFWTVAVLAAFVLVAAAGIAEATTLNIDFGSANDAGGGPNGTQSGFTAYEITDPGGSAFVDSMVFASDAGVGGTVTVTVTGSTNSFTRNYPGLSGGPDAGLDALLNDHVFLNDPGTLTLTLTNLLDGPYFITTYHHDSSGTAGELFDLRISDATRTNETIFTNVLESTGTAPNPATRLDFTFFVEGGNAVDITLENLGSNHAGFNGFELTGVFIPEPSTITLLGVGALGVIRRRRKRASSKPANR